MNMIKQASIFGSLVVLSVVIMIGCGKRVESPQKASVKEAENKVLSEQQEKGYDLPIEESEKQDVSKLWNLFLIFMPKQIREKHPML